MNRSNKNYMDKTSDESVADSTVDKLLDSIIDEQVKIFGKEKIKSED